MNRRSFVATAASLLAGMGVYRASAQHMHGAPAPSPMAGHDHGHDVGADLSMGAAYMTITNRGDNADRLVSIETDVAQAVEVHGVTMTGSVMEMNPLHDGLEIPAGETVSLEPGGYHIMLIGLTKSLVAGKSYDLTLTFERAGEVKVTVPILRREPKDGEAGEKVVAGDLEIDHAWSRQAPKIDAGVASPMASPEATPARG